MRRGARIPDARFVAMRGREPEGVIDAAAFLAFRGLGECRRPLRFGPAAAAIGRAEHCRTEMTGLGRGQQSASVARIEHQLTEHMPEKMRPVDAPASARRIAVKHPGALARGDQQRNLTRGFRAHCHRPLSIHHFRVVALHRFLRCFRLSAPLRAATASRFRESAEIRRDPHAPAETQPPIFCIACRISSALTSRRCVATDH